MGGGVEEVGGLGFNCKALHRPNFIISERASVLHVKVQVKTFEFLGLFIVFQEHTYFSG